MRSWLRRNELGIVVAVVATLYLGAAGFRVYCIITRTAPYGFNAPPDANLKMNLGYVR